MKFAYADPPYFGCSMKHYSDHPEAHVYDTLEGHQALIDDLMADYEDGWALSMTSGNLKDILPLCPTECRVGAWVKPFAAFKVNVGVAYAWEPVVFYGGRKRTRQQPTVRDWIAENITLQRGLTGAKPAAFCHWVMDVLNVQDGDTMVDVFHGSGAFAAAIAERFRQRIDEGPLFASAAWPSGCGKPNSCSRHKACTYGCKAHFGRPLDEVKSEIEAFEDGHFEAREARLARLAADMFGEKPE